MWMRTVLSAVAGNTQPLIVSQNPNFSFPPVVELDAGLIKPVSGAFFGRSE